jgi:hypothetical protein
LQRIYTVGRRTSWDRLGTVIGLTLLFGVEKTLSAVIAPRSFESLALANWGNAQLLACRRPLLFGSRILIVPVGNWRGLDRGGFLRFRSGGSESVTRFAWFDLSLGLFL